MSFFDELIEFDILGGFDEYDNQKAVIKRAKELGIDIDNYETVEELAEAILELEE